jgi:peptidoglycan/LPS O-acetylase OafA/YrhL
MAAISYRADIDGLRAIAVLSVVVFHTNPKLLPGGFLGVDIFFVISGFLITQLILSGLADGSFSFVRFYERRIRRLFPALFVVLLAVWVLGWALMLPADFAGLGKYALAGAAFGANILAYSEVGYFDIPAGSKPFLHLWSLGVEEQFYFVFPALFVWAYRAGAVRAAFALIGIASFAASVALVDDHPSFVFYLPFTRFWEFLAGALLAYRQSRPSDSAPISPLSRELSAVFGLLLILLAIFSPDRPGWWAVLPVLGAVLSIGAGSEARLNRKLLANPCLVFVGLISYPLYLWHWPLIVIGHRYVRTFIGKEHLYTSTIITIAVALAFILSYLTYRFVERPIRAGRFPLAGRPLAAALCGCMASVGLLGLVTAQLIGVPARYPEDIRALLAPLATPFLYGTGFPPADEPNNKAGPLLVAYGDSHASHLIPGFQLLQKERTFRLELVRFDHCLPLSDIPPANEEGCRDANERLFGQRKPDIVVLAASWLNYRRRIERLSDMVRLFQRIGVRRIVIVGSVPVWREPPQSLLYKAYRDDPAHKIPDRLGSFDTLSLELDQKLREIASATGVVYISAHDALCNGSGCLVRLGENASDILQVDGTHFSTAGSSYFVSHIASQIFGGA